MNTLNVGFDVDGVLYDFRKSHSDFEVARGNAHCALDLAADEWDYFAGWGMTLDEWLASYAEGVNAGHVLWAGGTLPGAKEAFDAIRAQGHRIHLVTDRSIGDDPQEATFAWLQANGLEPDSVTFSRDKTVVETDIFIEDRLENADALNAAGTLCYLINRPWNACDDDRPRVDTLAEFVERVMELAAVAWIRDIG